MRLVRVVAQGTTMETAESPGSQENSGTKQNSSSGILRSALDVAAFESVRPQLSALGSRVEDLGRSLAGGEAAIRARSRFATPNRWKAAVVAVPRADRIRHGRGIKAAPSASTLCRISASVGFDVDRATAGGS